MNLNSYSTLVALLLVSSILRGQVKDQFTDTNDGLTTVVIKEDAANDLEILNDQFDLDDVGMHQVIKITTRREVEVDADIDSNADTYADVDVDEDNNADANTGVNNEVDGRVVETSADDVAAETVLVVPGTEDKAAAIEPTESIVVTTADELTNEQLVTEQTDVAEPVAAPVVYPVSARSSSGSYSGSAVKFKKFNKRFKKKKRKRVARKKRSRRCYRF